jgi:hypothetical protein
MTNLAKSIQRELALFKDAIELDGGSIPEVHKSAFCKARKKLKHTVFIEFSQMACKEFYASDEVVRWKGYRVIGVDGSTHELPASKELKEKYGVAAKRADGKEICMARSLMIYDTLNHLTLYGEMDRYRQSEMGMLWNALSVLKLDRKDILVFDRYYASHLLIFYLHKRGVQFCFRMKDNWYEVQRFLRSGLESDDLIINLPARDQRKADELGIKEKRFKCRLVKVQLDSGETEILLTSLTNETKITVADLYELYGLRWFVEEAFKAFKHKVCLENFSGKSDKAVLQDFYVKIFIMNLTAVAVRPINEALKKPSVKVKYTYQVNFTEALATMKRGVVSFFITGSITKGLKRLYDRLQKATAAIRPGRKFKRREPEKRRFHTNYKPT